MNINEAIEKSLLISEYKSGGNKKCIIIDDYALLTGSININYMPRTIELLNEASNNNVNVVKILDYKIDESAALHNYGSGGCYQNGWILQDKAKGEELYSSDIKRISTIISDSLVSDLNNYLVVVSEYVKRLNVLASASVDALSKFVNDYDYLFDRYLNVDPSKSGNFFYDGNNFSFIDLEYVGPREINKKFMSKEIVLILKNYYIPRVYVNRNSRIFMSNEQLNSYNISINLLQGKLSEVFNSIGIDESLYLEDMKRSLDDVNNVSIYSSYEELINMVSLDFNEVEDKSVTI